MFENYKYLIGKVTGEATAPTTDHIGQHWGMPMGTQ